MKVVWRASFQVVNSPVCLPLQYPGAKGWVSDHWLVSNLYLAVLVVAAGAVEPAFFHLIHGFRPPLTLVGVRSPVARREAFWGVTTQKFSRNI